MRKQNKFFTYPVVIIALALLFIGCSSKKDENNPASQIPVLSTSAMISIGQTSAVCGGNITSQGGSPVSARGVCWSTSQNPTIADAYSSDSSGTGKFTSPFYGLMPITLYYVRAYATNSSGTAYGNLVSFTTVAGGANGQPCAGMPTITVNHVAGTVAPVSKTVTYGTVTNIPGETSKCWITSNLGADHQASGGYDNTEASAGWYWQFNRKQGYKLDGNNRTPNTSWITSISENSDWIAANDPCALELGSGWRIPTYSEWSHVGWGDLYSAWNSGLKVHAAGSLDYSGSLNNTRGTMGGYWSSTSNGPNSGYDMVILKEYGSTAGYGKTGADALRCIHD